MLIPMLKQLLEQGLLEGPKQAIEDAKIRIIFAVLGLIVGIVALTFVFYTIFLWLSVSYGMLHAAGIIAAVLILLTGACITVVCWPGDKKPRIAPPEAEAILAIEQLSRSMSELGRGKNGGLAMLGILAGVTALGFGLGRKN